MPRGRRRGPRDPRSRDRNYYPDERGRYIFDPVPVNRMDDAILTNVLNGMGVMAEDVVFDALSEEGYVSRCRDANGDLMYQDGVGFASHAHPWPVADAWSKVLAAKKADEVRRDNAMLATFTVEDEAQAPVTYPTIEWGPIINSFRSTGLEGSRIQDATDALMYSYGQSYAVQNHRQVQGIIRGVSAV